MDGSGTTRQVSADAREAIQTLYELYSQDIYRYARLTLGNPCDAKDVVQEVFFRAFRGWDGYREDANQKTWLMAIAKNYIYDLYRKRRTELRFLHSNAPSDTHELTESTISDELPVDPEALVDLERALANLRDSYRQVVVLRHIQGLSIQETAQILGWSESKVRSTTHRAIQKLRTLLRSSERRANLK